VNKLLIITNMYPAVEKPLYGIFVQEQVESYRLLYPETKISVIALNSGNYLQRYLFSMFTLLLQLLKQRPQIVHIHYGLTFFPVFFLLPFCKLLKVRIVTTFHGSDLLGKNKLTKFVANLAIRFSDAVVGVSQQTVNILKRKHKQVNYLPCGVTDEFVDFANQMESKRSRVIIFPSNPKRPEKNYPLFQQLTEELALEEGVIPFQCKTMDGLSRQQVVSLFKSSACLLLTSHYEGSPQVVKEAMICDLPIVSTAVGDVPYLLETQSDAVVSDKYDELYFGIKKILQLEKLQDCQYSNKDKSAVLNNVTCSKLHLLYQQLRS